MSNTNAPFFSNRESCIDYLMNHAHVAVTDAQGTECPVCREPYTASPDKHEPVRLPCHPNHTFGRHCLETWILEQPTCPTCRACFYRTSRNLSLERAIQETERDIRLAEQAVAEAGRDRLVALAARRQAIENSNDSQLVTVEMDALMGELERQEAEAESIRDAQRETMRDLEDLQKFFEREERVREELRQLNQSTSRLVVVQ
ncbi:hypothetical protein M011DRAFT_514936 [Sporormia fimetaria CBS 119925]|uniref:RING-type domain-containing protein n=1 Tax=Sporormia fimetaria CBS 119925 TaxID=1340428 RepID=A0A6A6VEH7_9PLEO|nr:hypothetical protein M011DRAFT_514936 [Sporormia fimetaria CBS 119925]